MNSGAKDAEGTSTKVSAAALGVAIATLVWTLLVAFSDTVAQHLDKDTVATVTGASAVVLAALLGWFVRERAGFGPTQAEAELAKAQAELAEVRKRLEQAQGEAKTLQGRLEAVREEHGLPAGTTPYGGA